MNGNGYTSHANSIHPPKKIKEYIFYQNNIDDIIKYIHNSQTKKTRRT